MNDLRVNLPEPCDAIWDKMTPDGCNRLCASCDKIVHDFAQYTFDEAETILRSGEQICAKVKLNPNGAILLQPSRKRSTRKIVAAISLSAGLFAMSGQAVSKPSKPPRALGSIKGTISGAYLPSSKAIVIASGPNGKKYQAKVDADGIYEIKKLPAGRYFIYYNVRCETYGDRYGAVGEAITVTEQQTTLYDYKDLEGCPIYVGRVTIQETNG
jgi:hypothetical protein